MHKLGWKSQFFKSAGVSMLGHGCGVSLYTQFYDRIKYIYQILLHTYMISYIGENGQQYFQEPWVLKLAKSVETFIMVSISDMPTSQCWINQKRIFLNNT